MEEKPGIVVIRYDHHTQGTEMLNRYTSEGYFILCANSVWNEKTGRMESEVILGLGRELVIAPTESVADGEILRIAGGRDIAV